jgi:polysaccharide pyruvyl transferase WcaK-like protein
MYILIIDAYTDGNIGSGALAENSIKLLRNVFPDAEIEMLAQFPEDMQRFTGLPNHPELVTMPFNKPRLQQVFWLAKTLPWMTLHAMATYLKDCGVNIPSWLYTSNQNKQQTIERLNWADMVVSIGAERINDNFYKAILFSLYQLWMVQLQRKFLVLFPQTIGPFHFSPTRWLSRLILKRCDVVFLRDRKSREILDRLGVIHPVIVDTYDVAVLQTPASTSQASELLSGSGIPSDGKLLVGISAMHWSYVKAQGESTYAEYREAIAQVADGLIEDYDVRIVFLATNVPVHGCREDDVAVARDISGIMRHKDHVHILDRLFSPAQMKGMMGLMELCIVTRMHACILSTGIATPTVTINYQFKLHEYMKQVGLGEYTIDIDQVTSDKLKKLVGKAWMNRNTMRTILVKSIQQMREQLVDEMKKLPAYLQTAKSRAF